MYRQTWASPVHTRFFYRHLTKCETYKDQVKRRLNPFNPEFQKWTLPSQHLDTSIAAKRVSITNQEQNSKSDPDETSFYELSHLDLHCLQKCLSWSTGLKGLCFLFVFLINRVKDLWPSQPIRVMLSRSVYLTILFLGRLNPPSS